LFCATAREPRPRWSFREIGAKANNNVAHYGGGGRTDDNRLWVPEISIRRSRSDHQLLPSFILIKAEQHARLLFTTQCKRWR